MRGFHAFGIGSALVILLVSFGLGGDALWRHLFQAGMVLFGLANVTMVWLGRANRAWDARVATAHWVIGGLGILPALYYFGPFSAVTLAFPLALMFVGLDRDRTTAFLVLGIAIAEHLIVAAPIILGWTSDVGLATAAWAGRLQLAVIETIILVLITAGLGLGLWARLTSAAALAELANARQLIGDQKQVLVEAQDRADEVNRVKSGRWTGQNVGPWRLGPVLGRGGMGEVYDGRDEKGQLAAVKVLGAAAEDSPSLVARFNRELQIAARLDSPHIVRVLDVAGAAAMVPYLAMERLQGVDLATRLRTQVRMPLEEVIGMLDQVARGLEVAHEAGVVHRDLKPQNLFLHDSTYWKILDFGVAKVFGIEGTLTRDAMVGTPQYMAPEQAVGENVTHLSDIYALGAIAYRCLTGRVPHGAREFTALIYQVVRGAPARPGTLARMSREVEDVLAVAMAKDPRQRFASAKEFVEQLSAAASGQPPRVQPPAGAWT
jgi:serine/threonine-protein kinase